MLCVLLDNSEWIFGTYKLNVRIITIMYDFFYLCSYSDFFSPLSPVLANIYIESFEEMALGSTSLKPSMWLRYVDDTFILWPHQEDVQILLDHVNSIRPSIQFTMEKEQDYKLHFLNVLVTRTEQGFRSSVYRKSTFTGLPQFQLPSSLYGKERNSPLLTTSSKNH